MKELESIIKDGCEQLGLEISDKSIKDLSKYNEILLEWNQVMNLTSIIEPKAVAVKHFVDCLAVTKAESFELNTSIIDIGTGAGFPGLPLKIFRPDLKLTLVDSLNKRCNFLSHVVKELNLNNVNIIHARAEDLGKEANYRENYDYVVSRAVARLPILLEYTLPFIKVSGQLVTLKGPEFDNEISEATNALKILNAVFSKKLEFDLPYFGDKRVIGVFKKIKKTPMAYPRKAGLPQKRPL